MSTPFGPDDLNQKELAAARGVKQGQLQKKQS